jgi:hypothetical protein
MHSTHYVCLVSRQTRHFIYLSLLFMVVVTGSCKKQRAVESNFAVLHIVGAIKDNKYVVTNFKGTQPLPNYLAAARIGTFQTPFPGRYYIAEPQQPLAFYTFPDTMPGSKPVLSMNLQLQKDVLYTLFVAGTTSSLDTVLIKENLPVIAIKDSVSAVRFVNLMSGAPVSVNLKGEPYGSALQSLPYMGVSAYARYPIRHYITRYEFEVRDAATGDLLVTYTDEEVDPYMSGGALNWLSKARTQVIAGTRGVTTGVNRMTVRYYFPK